MNSATTALCLILLLIPLWRRSKRSLVDGLCYGVLISVFLPTYFRIDLPGGLPDLTLQRMVLVILLMFWMQNPDARERYGTVRLKYPFYYWAIANFLSLVFTDIDFGTSLKRYLDFVLEVFLFYAICATTIRTREDAIKLLRSLWIGMTLVAIVALIERYGGTNPVDRLFPGYRQETEMRDILSTYPHRILLGTGMAMAWPLAFALLRLPMAERKVKSWKLWGSIIIIMMTCFFSMSRGPWIACAFALMSLIVLATGETRKRMSYIVVLIAIGLVLKPGVFNSIFDLAKSTTDEDSHKGGTFQYRLELWRIAWTKISGNPKALLFGFGPGAGKEMDLEWNLSYRGNDRKIESWDNQFAYDLFQSGLVGFFASFTLYMNLLWMLWSHWRRADGVRRDIQACLISGGLAFVFMMTNVMIFAKQLNFLLWSMAVAGAAIVLTGAPQRQENAIEADSERQDHQGVSSQFV